ncbi:MAG: hypothetical protein R2932_48325 [Caldilineaceae bacterium]
MVIELCKIGGTVLALLALLWRVHALGRRHRWQPEWQRKLMHIGLGTTSLTFPWLFDAIWQVGAVCGVGALILVAVRTVPRLRQSVGSVLHDVPRDSPGELLFALAIFLLFALSHATPVAYVLPLAVLTFADTAAALVGSHWGRHRYLVLDGHKSWEGVLAFALVTSGTALVALRLLTPLTWPTLLLLTLTIAGVGALIEAISWRGLDNLLVPLGLYLLLVLLLERNIGFLLYQLLGLSLLAITAQLAPNRLPLHSVLTALLTIYCLWLAGPLLWFVGLLTLLLLHTVTAQWNDSEQRKPLELMPMRYWLGPVGL